MKHPCLFKRIWAMVCLCALICGCGSQAEAAGPTATETARPAAPAATKRLSASEPVRSNTPEVLLPEAPGVATLGGDPLTVDVSNLDQGYVMARYNGSAAKASVLIIGPDQITYKYFLPSDPEFKALPLSSGDGNYAIEGYENVEGNSYAVLFKETVAVTLADERLPFLYSNLYVNFDRKSETVDKAKEIVAEAENDLDAVTMIYHYVVENVTYDKEKAATVTSGYLPVVDETLRTGEGICFDYAALTCAMLRSQRIPAKLEIGYAGTVYHAWISVYIEDIGWIDRLIEFTGDAWTRMDPTFAASNGNSDAILKYIGDGTNYNLQYSR